MEAMERPTRILAGYVTIFAQLSEISLFHEKGFAVSCTFLCIFSDNFTQWCSLYGVTKKLCPVCVGAVEELWTQSSQFLHNCIGQAST